MQYITLTRGYVAIVDDDDYPRLSQYKWHVAPSGKCKNKLYAVRVQRKDEYASYSERTSVAMHSMVIDCPSGQSIDHINGLGIDNRKENLRVSSHHQNMANQLQHKDSKSPYKGIWRAQHCDRWAAQIVHRGKKIYLGLYYRAEDAARAYDSKAVELFGPFAKCNFPVAA